MEAAAGRETVLSCIQPTAGMHIGNYFGAISNWVRLQDKYACIYGIVDLHAMTIPYEPAQLTHNTKEMVFDLLACGIDPDRSLVFIQSLVPEHTELAWILSCICPYGILTRMTQFKTKVEFVESSESHAFASAGLFTYPVLMAADVLVYRANWVPVGEDQTQHLELSRSLARRFNGLFGELFPEPQPLFTQTPKIMSPADPTVKMSKSLGPRHYIGLFEEEESITAKVKAAVTDSGQAPGEGMSPGVDSLFTMLRCSGADEAADNLEQDYFAGRLKYVHLKSETAAALSKMIKTLRERRAELLERRDEVLENVYESSKKTRVLAQNTIREVRSLVGLPELNAR